MSVDDGADTAVGGWRTLIGSRRRESRATTTVAPDDELAATQRMLDNTENRLLRVQAKTEALLAQLSQRRNWAGMTLDEVLKAVMDEVLEVYGTAIGKAKQS